MFKATRYLSPLILVTTVMLGTPACAAGVMYPQRYPVGDRDDRAFYNRGFREGRELGAEDARRGRGYDVQRHREYRDNRRGDDRGDTRAYRDGFAAGYDEGYRQFARGGYGDPRRAYPPARDYPRPEESPNYGVNRRFGSPAAENGFRDGLERGQRAARSGDRFDPVREKWYRDGDRDYDRRYGSRDEYKREYRAAFQQGYEEGYRGIRR